MAAYRAKAVRLVYLDYLKWVLIAGIIAYHAAVAYGRLGSQADRGSHDETAVEVRPPAAGALTRNPSILNEKASFTA